MRSRNLGWLLKSSALAEEVGEANAPLRARRFLFYEVTVVSWYLSPFRKAVTILTMQAISLEASMILQ